jgi:acetylornithine deacetylase/succinyl-diaminopimelate desuccinylase-like protein
MTTADTTLSAEELNEAVGYLRRAIQIDTVNPPGNEGLLAAYLQTVLSAQGIETHVLEPVAGRAAVIGRIRGTGAQPPVLLTAHMDVVGVERKDWSVDPFGGEVRDGYVYGRGAIDDKGMLVAELMALLLLKRRVVDRGGKLSRDVIFAATADEETGGEFGLGWIIERHPELLRAEFAINEGGRVRIVEGRPLYAAVQTAEKVSNVLSVKARGPAGHASIPLEGNAVARLARAVALIAAHREPVVLSATTRGFFGGLEHVWPDAEIARAMGEVASDEPSLVARGAATLARIPLFDAVLRSGISPTVFNAGIRHNVIPAHAEATLSVRTLPGESAVALVDRLRGIVNDPQVEITIADQGLDAPPSGTDTVMFRAIADAVTAQNPSLVTVPYMSTGATESAKLRAWGVKTYGILPFALDEDDERRMHGADERIPVESFAFGIRLLLDVLYRTVT